VRSSYRRIGGKPRAWLFAGRAVGRVAAGAMEAPRCLPGAGLEVGSGAEIIARSEEGDDGRLQSRRPGAGATEKGPQPSAESGASGAHELQRPLMSYCRPS